MLLSVATSFPFLLQLRVIGAKKLEECSHKKVADGAIDSMTDRQHKPSHAAALLLHRALNLTTQ
jgi:hypothetical protein